MTYKEKFVGEVKLNGKILRLKNDIAQLPFDSEYSILLKNLNSYNASVNIEIDGQDVLDGSSLLVSPNQTFEVMGFMHGNQTTNKFKFIQKTKEIQNYRGDLIGDGIIRIEFAFEKPSPKPLIAQTIKEVHHHYQNTIPYSYYSSANDWWKPAHNIEGDNSTIRSIGTLGVSAPTPEEGITVKGSNISQRFNYVSIGELEQSEIIIIKLCGFKKSGNQIIQPVTIQSKLQCSSCGIKSKSSFKFCPNCGTFLD